MSTQVDNRTSKGPDFQSGWFIVPGLLQSLYRLGDAGEALLNVRH